MLFHALLTARSIPLLWVPCPLWSSAGSLLPLLSVFQLYSLPALAATAPYQQWVTKVVSAESAMFSWDCSVQWGSTAKVNKTGQANLNLRKLVRQSCQKSIDLPDWIRPITLLRSAETSIVRNGCVMTLFSQKQLLAWKENLLVKKSISIRYFLSLCLQFGHVVLLKL